MRGQTALINEECNIIDAKGRIINFPSNDMAHVLVDVISVLLPSNAALQEDDVRRLAAGPIINPAGGIIRSVTAS